MPTSITELNQFVEFATGALNSGGDELSIEQLLKQWRAQREFDETVESIRRGNEQYKAGLGKPAAQVFAEIREQLGLNE